MNHAGPGPNHTGLDAIRAFHEGFLSGFLPAFSKIRIDYVQQVAEGDRVVSQMLFRADHTGPVMGQAATGKVVSLQSIRIDRLKMARSRNTGP